MGTNFDPWRGYMEGMESVRRGIRGQRERKRQDEQDVQTKERQNIWAEGARTENEKSKLDLQEMKDFTAHMADATQGEDLEARAYEWLKTRNPERAAKLQANFVNTASSMFSMGDPEKAVDYYNSKTKAGLKYQGTKGDFIELETGDGQRHLFNFRTKEVKTFGEKKRATIPHGAAVEKEGGGYEIPSPETSTVGQGRTINIMEGGKPRVKQFNLASGKFDLDAGEAPPAASEGRQSAVDDRQKLKMKNTADIRKKNSLQTIEKWFSQEVKKLTTERLLPDPKSKDATKEDIEEYQAAHDELVEELDRRKNEVEQLWQEEYDNAGYSPGKPIRYETKRAKNAKYTLFSENKKGERLGWTGTEWEPISP